MNQLKIIPLFMELKDTFDKHGVRFWLEGGTLLGMIRDKQLMPWDDDIDIATFRESIDIGLIGKELHKKGFDIYVRKNRLTARKDGESISLFLYDKNNDSYIREGYTGYKHRNIAAFAKFVFLGGLTTDTKDFIKCKTKKDKLLVTMKSIMLHIPAKKFLCNAIVKLLVEIKCYKLTCTSIPKEHYDKLNTIPFYGTEVYVPYNITRYLKGYFGKDWKKPKKEWNPGKKYHYEYRRYIT